MAAVAYERCSLTRGSNFKGLSGKIFCVLDNCLWEVVAYERWSHMEVGLYFEQCPLELHYS